MEPLFGLKHGAQIITDNVTEANVKKYLLASFFKRFNLSCESSRKY
jgi:hypothetical protein